MQQKLELARNDILMKKESSLGIYIALGAGIGTALGVAMNNIGVGVGIGAGIGLAIGFTMIRRKSEKEEDK